MGNQCGATPGDPYHVNLCILSYRTTLPCLTILSRCRISTARWGRGAICRSAYRVGQRVEVLYPPGQPHAARLCSFLELWFGPILFTGMGRSGLSLLGVCGTALGVGTTGDFWGRRGRTCTGTAVSRAMGNVWCSGQLRRTTGTP